MSAVLGRYQIIAKVAESNDIIYEGYDPKIGRRVAIKKMVVRSGVPEAALREKKERFAWQALAAASLDHPNIVATYDAGENTDGIYIVMEFLDGQTLRSYLSERGRLDVDEALQIAAQICDAIEYASSQGVVHRDIKPENIITLLDSRVKITDFGIAKLESTGQLVGSRQIIGTPHYMSPEQIRGRRVDRRSDIFSTGIVLYEMVMGRKPFEGKTVEEISNAIDYADPIFDADVAPEVCRIIMRAVQKDPKARYQTPKHMLQDIKDLIMARSYVREEPVEQVSDLVGQRHRLLLAQLGVEPLEAVGHRIRLANWAGVGLLMAFVILVTLWAAFFRPSGVPASSSTPTSSTGVGPGSPVPAARQARSPVGKWRAPARTSVDGPGAGAPTGPGGLPPGALPRALRWPDLARPEPGRQVAPPGAVGETELARERPLAPGAAPRPLGGGPLPPRPDASDYGYSAAHSGHKRV